MERVTPTGLYWSSHLGQNICRDASRKIVSTGIGLGSRDGALPNILRATLLKRSDVFYMTGE